MTKPAHQHDPRRQQGQQPAPTQSGIINDVPPAPQSMIINDLYPAPQTAGQQMIVNDMNVMAGHGGNQQMFVNDPRHAQQQNAPQQMIVNDMAFSDLVKGLEALSKGEAPGGNQMIINDLTPAPQAAPRAAPPQQRQIMPAAAPTQQIRPQPAAMQPQQRQQPTQQMPVQQRMQQLPAPQQMQQMPPPRQQMQAPAPQAAPPQNQMQRQGATVDPRLVRQAAQPQPMVINTPQPLVKPRRDDMIPQQYQQPAQHQHQQPAQHQPQQPARNPANRQQHEPAARQSAPLPAQPESQQSAATRAGKKTAAPARRNQSRHDSAAAKGSNPEEWKGSYSGRTMTPSLVLCIGLTVLSGWFTFRFVPMSIWLEFLGASLGAIWVLQLVRWAYRVVGFRYRLTPEHLMLHRGLLYGRPVQVPRCQIMKVSVSANLLEKILGVGKIVVEVKDGNPGTVELEGVRRPKEVVEIIDPKHARTN